MKRKGITEKLKWYQAPELRKWKRIYHFIELTIVSLLLFFTAAYVFLNCAVDGVRHAFAFFVVCMAISSISLIIGFVKHPELERWLIHLLILGAIAGGGLASLAGFLIITVVV